MVGKFSIVLFEKSNRVDIVPTEWICRSDEQCHCYWPPSRIRVADVMEMVKEAQPFSHSWKTYKCRILKHFGKLQYLCDSVIGSFVATTEQRLH